MMIDFPDVMRFDNESHNIRLATGSIPHDGSSRNTNGGSPINAMAVLNFRLLPPLQERLLIKLKIFKSEENQGTDGSLITQLKISLTEIGNVNKHR